LIRSANHLIIVIQLFVIALSGIVPKRLNASSKFFHCLIAASFICVSRWPRVWRT